MVTIACIKVSIAYTHGLCCLLWSSIDFNREGGYNLRVYSCRDFVHVPVRGLRIQNDHIARTPNSRWPYMIWSSRLLPTTRATSRQKMTLSRGTAAGRQTKTKRSNLITCKAGRDHGVDRKTYVRQLYLGGAGERPQWWSRETKIDAMSVGT